MTQNQTDRPARNLATAVNRVPKADFFVSPEILEAAEDIADCSDVPGLERGTLELLVRTVLFLDRQERDR